MLFISQLCTFSWHWKAYRKQVKSVGRTGNFYRRALKGESIHFSQQPIGFNCLKKLMQTMCLNTGLKGYFTNHSGKRTFATALFQGEITCKKFADVQVIVASQCESKKCLPLCNKNKFPPCWNPLVRRLVCRKHQHQALLCNLACCLTQTSHQLAALSPLIRSISLQTCPCPCPCLLVFSEVVHSISSRIDLFNFNDNVKLCIFV